MAGKLKLVTEDHDLVVKDGGWESASGNRWLCCFLNYITQKRTMKIRNIDLGEKPVLLAPMEDVTDPAFRLLCKEFGADMVYTEFVSSDALIRSVGKTMLKLNISEKERPVAIQIYGKDTDTMVEAARIVEQANPDILDLNFGCPVKRVAGKGAGSGMLQNIPKYAENHPCGG